MKGKQVTVRCPAQPIGALLPSLTKTPGFDKHALYNKALQSDAAKPRR